MRSPTLNRRDALALMSAGAAYTAASLCSPRLARAGLNATPVKDKFLWGAATAGHQVEGNLVNDDCWLLENLPNSMFKEPSGDACDHYHLYESDIAMLASFGLNAYRFSVEWSRIEPVEGSFSQAELGHYRRVLEVCHQHGVTPLVTYSHDAVPAWFAIDGAWENPNCAARFARYCSVVTKSLGDLMGYAMTLNEPNLPMLFRWIAIPHVGTVSDLTRGQLPNIRKQTNQPRLSTYFAGDPEKIRDSMLIAHAEGRKAIKAERSSLPVGFSLAIEDDQAPLPEMHQESHVEEKRRQVYGPWFNIAKSDDYIGIQNYGRSFVGKTNLAPPQGAEHTQEGGEFYPEGLEHTIRLTAKETGVPVMVTENGVAIADDTRRVEFIRRAVAGVERCRKDGIHVPGYIHWSLLDNFEWIFGYERTLGLVAVDRATQKRTPKPSAYFLGSLAKSSQS
jgi:beta-glucosidase